jgi:hypothetical protein
MVFRLLKYKQEKQKDQQRLTLNQDAQRNQNANHFNPKLRNFHRLLNNYLNSLIQIKITKMKLVRKMKITS